MSKKPLVSIVCITFNQVRFIKETLQGFIMQKANFEFEVLIHDDASTDGTRQIIEDYAKKYPEIIKPVYEENNQYSQGDYTFINDTFRRAKGLYVAFCEGDDFWTDPDKLQIQVDFLEANTSCALCFHPVRVFFEGNDQPESTYPSDMAEANFTLNELLRRNYIQSNSVLYRRQNYDKLPSNVIPSDWYMHLYHAQFGDIGYIDRVMSAYRRHEGGVWWESKTPGLVFWEKYAQFHINLFEEVKKLFMDCSESARMIIIHGESALILGIIKTCQQTQEGKKFLSSLVIDNPSIFIDLSQILQKELEKSIGCVQANKNVAQQSKKEMVLKNQDLEIVEHEIKEIRSSLSWRITKPLRLMGNLLKNKTKT